MSAFKFSFIFSSPLVRVGTAFQVSFSSGINTTLKFTGVKLRTTGQICTAVLTCVAHARQFRMTTHTYQPSASNLFH